MFHPNGERPLTLLEVKVIQGFRMDMKLHNCDSLLNKKQHHGTKSYKRQTGQTCKNKASENYVAYARLIGNAVCPPVARAYAAAVWEMMSRDRQALLLELSHQ